MQLARTYSELNIIGLGAQDNLDQANQFIARTGTAELNMVWDPSFDSWRGFGVRSQPYWILYGPDGTAQVSRPGAIDFDAIAAAL